MKQNVSYQNEREEGDRIERQEADSPARMTALLSEKLMQVIEANEAPDAKTLRDCVAVLKELTAIRRELQPPEDDGATGVIILPAAQGEE